MNFKVFEDMYKMLWALIYDILKMFGIEKNAEGNLEDVPAAE